MYSGGSGLGGAIFVRENAILTITDGGGFSDNTVTAGSGYESPNGQRAGQDLFLMPAITTDNTGAQAAVTLSSGQLLTLGIGSITTGAFTILSPALLELTSGNLGIVTITTQTAADYLGNINILGGTLKTASSIGGTTTVNGGTLEVDAGAVFTHPITFTSGTVALNGAGVMVDGIPATLNANQALTIENAPIPNSEQCGT